MLSAAKHLSTSPKILHFVQDDTLGAQGDILNRPTKEAPPCF
jgi:hypothetical protein